MSNLELVTCSTKWGKWWQTVHYIYIEIQIDSSTHAQHIKINVTPTFLHCWIHGKSILRGNLFRDIIVDETAWTLEDEKLVIRIVKNEANGWASLMEGQYTPNSLIMYEMTKQLEMEKFINQNQQFKFKLRPVKI